MFVLTFWATWGLGAAGIEWATRAQAAWGNDPFQFVWNGVLAVIAPLLIIGWWVEYAVRLIEKRKGKA